MVNMAKAPSIWGNYTGAPHNPILSNANTTDYCKNSSARFAVDPAFDILPIAVQTVGHADIFQDAKGDW